jgi:hypothetical protein
MYFEEPLGSRDNLERVLYSEGFVQSELEQARISWSYQISKLAHQLGQGDSGPVVLVVGWERVAQSSRASR